MAVPGIPWRRWLGFLIITMGNIPYKTIEELRRTIWESNKDSISGSQRYVYWKTKLFSLIMSSSIASVQMVAGVKETVVLGITG